ncbi:Splicing factor 3A subunit 2 [Cladochytrium tenue]|nr:Splicing factor 3A subunit 2 [Cladochytrium tenue]
MDFQNRAGSKVRSGGVAGASETNVDRRERLRKLALETIDLAKDPYFMKNHIGSYECKLYVLPAVYSFRCLTLHSNEGSYLAHTQGKKHQTNLQRRAARDARDLSGGPSLAALAAAGLGGRLLTGPDAAGPHGPGAAPAPRRSGVKIGRPGYKVTKVRDPFTRQVGLLFQIQYPEMLVAPLLAPAPAAPGQPPAPQQQQQAALRPRHRFMSAYEQRVEAPSRAHQYLLVAAEPYETIAFKIQSREIDRSEGKFWSHWDSDSRQFHLQFFFKPERPGAAGAGAPDAAAASSVPPRFVPTGANARPVF